MNRDAWLGLGLVLLVGGTLVLTLAVFARILVDAFGSLV